MSSAKTGDWVGPARTNPARANPARTNPDSARDVRLMMRHFGVDPDRLARTAPTAARHAEQACACCLTVARCHAWLKNGRTGDEPAEFCPNAHTFEALAKAAPAYRGG